MPTKVNQIKKLRSESKLTQAEIARRVRTSTGYVNNIVKGRKRRPTMKSMSEILAEAQRRAVPAVLMIYEDTVIGQSERTQSIHEIRARRGRGEPVRIVEAVEEMVAA